MNYLKKHYEFILAFILLIICFLLYCINIENYPFIDTDETKYVSIAKDMLNYSDWINIKLNGENAFDCFPLFFWITNLSCLILGKISTFAVRLPISVISLAGILFLFFTVKRILSKSYAFIISLIMATCLGSIIFSRLATSDSIFTNITMIAILFSYLSVIEETTKKKFLFWLCTYFFCALSVLCSGLFGAAIIAVSIITIYIFAGKVKEIFKPVFLFPGIIVFAIIVCPWNFIMLHKHGFYFIKEQLFLYNFLNYIGIKQILTVIFWFILGFMPWIFSFLWILGTKLKDILNSVYSYIKDNSQEKLQEKWNKLNNIDKFLSMNTIVFFTAFIFALLYGTKYSFLILFLMFPASCISGHYWYEYIIEKEHDKSIFFSTLIPNLVLIICSLIGLFGHNIINTLIFQGLNHLIIPLVIIFFVIPLIGIFSVILKGRITALASNLLLMICLSFVITPSIFNFMSAYGGENDLINFAQKANHEKVKLAAFIPSKKYSLIYYYDKPVNFYNNKDLPLLKKYLEENQTAYVVVEIKDLWEIEENNIKYLLIDSGKRYCLIQYMPYIPNQEEDEEEPEIIVY